MTQQERQMAYFADDIEIEIFEHDQDEVVSYGITPPDQIFIPEEHESCRPRNNLS